MALGFWAKDYLGPKKTGGSGGGFAIAHFTHTSDTAGTCDMSYNEINALLEAKTPVLMVWAYKPDDVPFYVELGSCLVEEATGTLRIKINDSLFTCTSSDGNNWTQRS